MQLLALLVVLFCGFGCQAAESGPFSNLLSTNLQDSLVDLLRGACDPTCCGQAVKPTSPKSSLPCCLSCDGLLHLDKYGIPFSIPSGVHYPYLILYFRSFLPFRSNRMNTAVADDETVPLVAADLADKGESIQERISQAPPKPDDVHIDGCACEASNWKTTSACCPCNKSCKSFGPPSSAAPSVALLEPVLYVNEHGKYRWLYQDVDRKIVTERACWCPNDGVFTADCKSPCDVDSVGGGKPGRDEL
jgi:hypothetical protein